MVGDLSYLRGMADARKANGQGDPAGVNWSNIWSGVGDWVNRVSGTSANNAFNAQEAEKARLFNAAEAAKQREHELYMSNTAYQRAAADMKAAGINPATLSGLASGGAVASSSSSSAASASHAASGSGSNGPVSIIQSLIGLVGLISVAGIRGAAIKMAAATPRFIFRH